MSFAPNRKVDQPPLRFLLAIAITVGAFLLRQGLVHLGLEELPPFITLFPAVMLVALLFGLWPGLLTATLAARGNQQTLLLL
jgi:hypothetical protein